MAGERTLPGLGFTGFYTPGSHGWGSSYNDMALRASVLCQLAVKSATKVLPGSPSNGDIYIIPAGETNEHKIAVRDNNAWVYIVPLYGFFAYTIDNDTYLKFNGTKWVVGAGGVTPTSGRTTSGTSDTLKLKDANNVVTADNSAIVTITIPPNGSVAFPVWSTVSFVQLGYGRMALTAGTGVELKKNATLVLLARGRYSIISILKVAVDTWVVTGDLEPV